MSIQIQRRRYDCSALPKGWKREEVFRKNCPINPGKLDVFYFSPCGRRIRSKPQLVRFLGDSIDLSSFDYRTGKINPMLVRKKKCKGALYDYSRGLRNDSSLVPPIRQTASIFKQPVTVVKTQSNSCVKNDIKHGTQIKPKQLFWEKRLQGLGATCLPSLSLPVPEDIELPASLRPVGPQVTSQTVLQSLATALHIINGPITGQTEGKQDLQTNPAVFVNPKQPLIEQVQIKDSDIFSQETTVEHIRNRLQKAISQIAL